MAIVYQYDRRHDVTYVYYSESYYDKDKKQSRSRRTLLGKLNPDTKEVVPTKRTKRSKPMPTLPPDPLLNPKEADSGVHDQIAILQARVKDLEDRLQKAEEHAQREKQETSDVVGQMKKLLTKLE